MSDIAKYARPYAQAAFATAKEQNQIDHWEKALQQLAAITAEADVIKLLKNPQLSSTQKAELCLSLLGSSLDPKLANLIRLLAENNRLSTSQDIARLFSDYRAASEKILNVKVSSTVELNEDYQQQLIKVLSKKLGNTVTLTSNVDPSLIGGLIIHANDWVFDASIRGQFQRIKQALIS
jgi:F-type H+-transporting ATPase subunit delta